jgi:autotransporter-associated beta strand protein
VAATLQDGTRAGLTFNRSGTVTFAGTISGTGTVQQIGPGITILTADNTYTGGTTIAAGTLQLGDGGTTDSILGDVRNDSPHSLVFNRSDTLLFQGVISGIGAVRQEGTGTTVPTGDSTYTGGTTIAAGTLQLGAGGTSGSIVGDVANNGTLAFNRVDSRATGDLIGLQAGFDILRTNPYAGGHRDHAGVYVAYTDYNAPKVSGFALGQQNLHVGRLSMSGPAVGAYWTHFGPGGWYVDAVFQSNWFEVKANSGFGSALNTNGMGYAASLEAGYPIHFGTGWQIEPQGQMIWQGASIDDSRDMFSSVAWDAGNAATGRLGARLQYTGRDERTVWQPYAKVNLWHTFSGTDRISFGGGAPIEHRFGDTAIDVGAGVTARISRTTSLYAHADYRVSVGGGRSEQSATQGAIGIRVNW